MRGKQEERAAEQGSEAADDLLWGINAVYEALQQNSKAISEVLIQQGKTGARVQQIIDLARSAAVSVRFVDPRRLGVPPHCRHQGVVARHSASPLLSLDELLAGLAQSPPGQQPRLLVLDSIQDPRNLGSIFRSALASGFDQVILPRERSSPVTGTVARTSAGIPAAARAPEHAVMLPRSATHRPARQTLSATGAARSRKRISSQAPPTPAPARIVVT